jgi:hypothetical protein
MALVEFSPYNRYWWCDGSIAPSGRQWTYDVRYGEGYVEVLGDDPEDPLVPDCDVLVKLGEVKGGPGDEVELPVYVAASCEVTRFRLCVELDPSVVEATGFVVLAEDGRTGEAKEREVERGELVFFKECLDENGDGILECVWDHPGSAKYWETEGRWALVDVMVESGREYPGEEYREVGRLQLRIRADAVLAETQVVAGVAMYDELGFQAKGKTGVYVRDTPEAMEYFGPAQEVLSGRVEVELPVAEEFIRGDSNGDGMVNLTDAVATLLYLFQGTGGLNCLEAGDADKSGSVDITDPIRVLGVLFLGQEVLPTPYPECGREEAGASLGCIRSACENGN